MAKSGWSVPPTAFIGVVEEELADLQRRIAVEALQMIISGSPVDEGAYRANHRVSIDSDDFGYDINAIDKEGQATQDAGMQVIMSMPGPYCVITISNSLPYAVRLENGGFNGPTDKVTEQGYSRQAPMGVYGPTYATIVAKYGGNQ